MHYHMVMDFKGGAPEFFHSDSLTELGLLLAFHTPLPERATIKEVGTCPHPEKWKTIVPELVRDHDRRTRRHEQ